MITADVEPDNRYQYYLIKFEKSEPKNLLLLGFELYATKPDSNEEPPTEDYLTPMLKDDNSSPYNLGYSGACATPYGIVVAGGIKNNGDEDTYDTSNKALMYWPHAINKYDGVFKGLGISRSLPTMNVRRQHFSLVWHKGKIYAIGGKDSTEVVSGNNFAEYLDYNDSMTWVTKQANSYTPNTESFMNDLKRYDHGACSFGDEIFIFGGRHTHDGAALNDAYAWNPDTGRVRTLSPMNKTLAPCSAVAFGSKIYVIGMNGTTLHVLEYTP